MFWLFNHKEATIESYIFYGFLIFYIGRKLLMGIIMIYNTRDLLNRADQNMKKEIIERIKINSELSDEAQQKLLQADTTTLLKYLNNGAIRSEELVNFYYYRAVRTTSRLNLIVDIEYQKALQLAQICDKIRKKTPKKDRHALGPLFGVPILVKDLTRDAVKHSKKKTTVEVYNPFEDDDPFIQYLKEQGAIPLVKCNIVKLEQMQIFSFFIKKPQNPWKEGRIPGCCPGGEAAFIADKGIPISFSTDVFGGLRVSAAYCGTYGFRSTLQRNTPEAYSNNLNESILMKYALINPSIGPITKSIADIEIALKSIFRPVWHFMGEVIPTHWDDEYKIYDNLNIGYTDSMNVYPSSSAHKTAVSMALEVLENRGHKLINIDLNEYTEIVADMACILAYETKLFNSYKYSILNFQGEDFLQDHKHYKKIRRLPTWLKKLFNMAYRYSKRLIDQLIIKNTINLTEENMKKCIDNISEFKKRIFDKWCNLKLDCIILPATALPSPDIYNHKKLLISEIYTLLSSLLNTPTGIIPIKLIDKKETEYQEPRTINMNYIQFGMDCMKNSENLPVCIQVLTLPFQDEKCVGIMKQIDDDIKFMKKIRFIDNETKKDRHIFDVK